MISAADSEYNKVGVVSTGLPQLDRILGIGGIPFKRITEISGTWSVGKTTLALQTVAQGQREGYKTVWMDAEWAWENQYAETLGVNTKKLQLLQTRASEESLDEILKWCEDKKDSVIVIDAVGALHPSDEASKESGERTIGSQSSLVARFCRKVIPLLAMNNHALIVLNHEYTPIISTGGRPQLKTSGGAKLEYHKSIWIRLQKNGTNLKQGDEFVGYVVEAEVRKNKLAPTQKQKCEMEMFYGRGFKPEASLLKDALAKGIIVKEGGNYFFEGSKVAFGQPKLRDWVAANEELIKAKL